MKKLLTSLLVVGVAGAAVIGGVTAFFSDTETSTGNILQAGAIDLGIDNHSYYNGVLNPGTTWGVDYDISDAEPRQFFNFTDVKPGDWGEDTISLHVNNNDSYVCADVTLTSDNDNDLTEPEGDDGDATGGIGQGELADAITFYWWADDGDNVFETDEHLLPASPMGALSVGQTATVALADSQTNIWGDTDAIAGNGAPLPGDTVRFVAKAWCFGDTTMTPSPQDGGNKQNGPDDRPVVCDGVNVNNVTQTDSFTADISFRAVQSRNNESFVCRPPEQQLPKVGAGLESYVAPSGCVETVTGSESIQTAIGAVASGQTVCVDPSYDKTGDNVAIRINKDNVTVAALTRGIDLDVPVVLDNDGTTITGFTGFIGQAESPAEQAAFYIDGDAENVVISFNDVLSGTGAVVLTETGGTNNGGLIANNVLSGATQGIYTNPHTGILTIEYNDIDNNVAGIGGLMGAVVQYNEFEHATPASEAIGIDSTFDSNFATINFNNFLNSVKIADYGATAIINAENNFFSINGASQTTTNADFDFTPEAGGQYPHN